jgi:LacI family transcriptional regulator
MKKEKKVTMSDIANMANVSQSTVSHVINKTAPISEKIKNRINELIIKLNYIPNSKVRSPRIKKIATIGLIIPDVRNSFYTETIMSIEEALVENGYSTIFCNTCYNKDQEETIINTLIQKNVDGIIICYGLLEKKLYKVIFRHSIPLVVIDDIVEIDGVVIPSIEVNNISGSKMAVEHLYNIKSKNVCFASEPLFNKSAKLRYEGFQIAMKEFGNKIGKQFIHIESSQYNKLEMGRNIGAKIILDGSVDAVFANSDNLALGIMERLIENEVKIPEEIAIIGFDDIPIARFVTPKLSSISQPIILMAKTSVDILIKMIQRESVNKKQFIIEPSLIIRESTMRKVIK